MPSINLRLSDAEHAELTEWARVGQRSIQKEIVWRLFTIEGGQAPKYAPARSALAGRGGPGVDRSATEPARVEPPRPASADSEDRSVRGRTLPDERPIRTDFK